MTEIEMQEERLFFRVLQVTPALAFRGLDIHYSIRVEDLSASLGASSKSEGLRQMKFGQ